MANRFYKILDKAYNWLYYIILVILFLKGEIFRVQFGYLSFKFTSAKNLVLIFIVIWLLLRIRKKPVISIQGLILVSLCAVLNIFSINHQATLAASYTLSVYALWFFSISCILKDNKVLRNTIIMMLALAGFVNIINLYFHYSVDIEAIVEKYPFWQGKNAFGLFLAIALCLSGCLTAKKHWAWLIGVNALLLIPGIIMTYSRSAWFASILAILGIALFKLRRAVWIITGCAVIIFIASPSFVLNRFNSIFSGEDTNVKQRLEVWDNTIEIIKERPVTGTGLGTFTKAYRNKFPDYAPLQGEGARTIRHAHNLYLQILAETGVIGLVFFIFILIAGIVLGIRKLVKEKDLFIRSVRYGSLLGIAVFLVYSITDCTVSWKFVGDSFSHINLIWVMLWAIVLKPVLE